MTECVRFVMSARSQISFTGQAGFIFKSSEGTAVGVDLYLSDCVERFDGFKRLCPKVVKAEELDLDAVIATHWHLDHFDIDAMPVLMANNKTRLFAAQDCKEHIENLHLDEKRVSYLSVGDTLEFKDFVINAVFCDHGEGTPLAIGLVLEFDGYKAYIAGDTCLRIDKAEEISAYGPFDMMIAPINGAFGNLNEKDCVELCRFHKPRIVIPCHYWMFAEHHGDPGVFIKDLEEEMPGQKYYLMRPGEFMNIHGLIG